MSDNREYLSGRDESFVSPHSPGTSNGYTDEIVFGGLSPVSYERYAERFARKYNEIMSKMMNIEAEVGSSGMTSVWRVPSFGMHRGTSNPSSGHNRPALNTEGRQKRKEHSSNPVPKPRKIDC